MQTHEPAPARTLDGCGGSIKLLLKGIEGTEVLFDGLAEGTLLQGSAFGASRGQVLPEQGVVNVTYNATMKRDQ